MNFTTQVTCRLCDGALASVVNLGKLALTSYFPWPNEKAPRIPLTVMACESCGLLQLGENTKPELMYRSGYGYKSGINETMAKHLAGIVSVGAKYVSRGDNILDIGCNDGTLLKAWLPYTVHRFGIDPIGQNVDGCAIDRTFFAAHGRKYKVITSIAMFYDVPDPVGFAKDIEKSLAHNGVWLLEVGYAGAIQQGYWDGICHEHLTYYSMRQIDLIAKKADMNVLEYGLNPVNGGSLFCVIGKGKRTDIDMMIRAESEWQWHDLPKKIKKSCAAITDAVNGYRTHVLGASTKGNTLLQVCGLTHGQIEAAVERNPDKVGRLTPGSNIPIQSERWADENPPERMLVLPYHFKEQLLRRYSDLRERGVKFIFPLPVPEIV